jgi:hypothetical protein
MQWMGSEVLNGDPAGAECGVLIIAELCGKVNAPGAALSGFCKVAENETSDFSSSRYECARRRESTCIKDLALGQQKSEVCVKGKCNSRALPFGL